MAAYPGRCTKLGLKLNLTRILVRAAEGYLEVEGYANEELAAAGRPPYVASPLDYKGSGRAKWIRTTDLLHPMQAL